jgi:hypothetical protein
MLSSLFHSLEKPVLAPLPAERFDMSEWTNFARAGQRQRGREHHEPSVQIRHRSRSFRDLILLDLPQQPLAR